MPLMNRPKHRPAMMIAHQPVRHPSFDLLDMPLLGAFLRWRHARTALQVPLLVLSLLVLDDGFFGPQLAPENLAGVLPWVQWHRDLGPETSKVAFVAITVDPETDTARRIAQYSQVMGMAGKWEFLTGSRAALTPFWSAYHVAPNPSSKQASWYRRVMRCLAIRPSKGHTVQSFTGSTRRGESSGYSIPIFPRRS